MRRTLTVLVTSAAFLLPAAAASAAPVVEVPGGANASCSNGKGGNTARTLSEYNGKGNATRAVELCGDGVVSPPGIGWGNPEPDGAL